MRIDDFDFELPERCIALRPVEPRDQARLLVVNPHQQPPLRDEGVLSLPQFLRPGDAVVFNDTRVIPAQLTGIRRRTGDQGILEAKVAVTLHKRTSEASWDVFVKPAKKLAVGDEIAFSDALSARVVKKNQAGDISLMFSQSGQKLEKAIADTGVVPLPPYISGKRPTDEKDRSDYQTIYAQKPGAVAAPTAGLHTTQRLLSALDAAGVERLMVTLHVGAGTFLPVKVENTEDHVMHAEVGILDAETAERLNDVRKNGGRIVAVGTTSLRLLESAVDCKGIFHPFHKETDIFITPGYEFRGVDLLMTNFHLPRSTLFMLVSAFSGLDLMKQAYAHAIADSYRFYSYGDASLLWRENLDPSLI